MAAKGRKKTVRILTDLQVLRSTTRLDKLYNLDSTDESDDYDYAVVSDRFFVDLIYKEGETRHNYRGWVNAVQLADSYDTDGKLTIVDADDSRKKLSLVVPPSWRSAVSTALGWDCW